VAAEETAGHDACDELVRVASYNSQLDAPVVEQEAIVGACRLDQLTIRRENAAWFARTIAGGDA
jgi:hypothetical protein